MLHEAILLRVVDTIISADILIVTFKFALPCGLQAVGGFQFVSVVFVVSNDSVAFHGDLGFVIVILWPEVSGMLCTCR